MILLAAALVCLSPAKAAVTFDWAAVGDVANAEDPLNSGTVSGIGSVATAYKIATKEVNLIQYTEFLNPVASTDIYGLYNTNMATNLNIAGISRSGSSGSYTYSVIGSGLRPVTYVSWNDSARFVNWLQNGQESRSTETGTYDISLRTPVRLGSATYFLPAENEWYKAAYYQPEADGGPADSYWLYPTESESYYGTYDQGGNVREWNETIDLHLARVPRGRLGCQRGSHEITGPGCLRTHDRGPQCWVPRRQCPRADHGRIDDHGRGGIAGSTSTENSDRQSFGRSRWPSFLL